MQATPQPDLLRKLAENIAIEAIHTSFAVESQERCLPGTRTFTLERLRTLATATDNKDPDVIWMHGPAGAGKSAIMRTMANTLEEEGTLLASFFFFRADNKRNTSAPFIPTLALQAIQAVRNARPHILAAMQGPPNVFSQPTRPQSRLLLEDPLITTADTGASEWPEETPLVIIIDGLDECGDGGQQVEIIEAMAQLTTTIRTKTKRRLKVIIASRPEYDITSQVNSFPELVSTIELDSSDANIELFYDTHLDKLRDQHHLPETWPPPAQVRWLKAKSSGQYFFARISMGFLAGGDPVARLEMLVNNLFARGLQPFECLDALYATILRQVPPEMLKSALLILRLRLHPTWDAEYTPILQYLLCLPVGYIPFLSRYLASLINFNSGLTPYDASFGDFIGDPSRSGKHDLFIEPRILANAVAQGILSLCDPGFQTSTLTRDERCCLLSFADNQLPGPLFVALDSLAIDETLQRLARCTSEMDLYQAIWLRRLQDTYPMSFANFLADPERSGQSALFVEPTTVRQALLRAQAIKCLLEPTISSVKGNAGYGALTEALLKENVLHGFCAHDMAEAFRDRFWSVLSSQPRSELQWQVLHRLFRDWNAPKPLVQHGPVEQLRRPTAVQDFVRRLNLPTLDIWAITFLRRYHTTHVPLGSPGSESESLRRHQPFRSEFRRRTQAYTLGSFEEEFALCFLYLSASQCNTSSTQRKPLVKGAGAERVFVQHTIRKDARLQELDRTAWNLQDVDNWVQVAAIWPSYPNTLWFDANIETLAAPGKVELIMMALSAVIRDTWVLDMIGAVNYLPIDDSGSLSRSNVSNDPDASRVILRELRLKLITTFLSQHAATLPVQVLIDQCSFALTNAGLKGEWDFLSLLIQYFNPYTLRYLSDDDMAVYTRAKSRYDDLVTCKTDEELEDLYRGLALLFNTNAPSLETRTILPPQV